MSEMAKSVDKIALTAVIAIPALAGLVMMFFPRGAQHTDGHGHTHYGSDGALKWTALIVSLFTFVSSLHLPANFDYKVAGFQPKFDIDLPWIASPDRKSTRLNSSHIQKSRMPSSA